MTRPELHTLVDIVMDARERYEDICFDINEHIEFHHMGFKYISSTMYDTFSEFTKEVKNYIKNIEK